MQEYLLLIAGIILLIKGADWLIDGSSSLAKKLGLSSFVIGMTVVAFGTSLPEFIISIMAAIKNSQNIILGNVIGSNISNILLILGVLAIISPIKLRKSLIKTDLLFSIFAALSLLITTLIFGSTNLLVGIVFILFFILFFYFRFTYKKKEFKNHNPFTENHSLKNIIFIILGSISLFMGGRFAIDSVLIISKNFGLSEFLISATAIAIGTSLPELVVSIKAIIKKKKGLAIGNIIGSNIFNILWVLGFVSLFKSIKLPIMIQWDLIFLLIGSFVIFLFAFIKKKYLITRYKGIMLLILYGIYITKIIIRG